MKYSLYTGIKEQTSKIKHKVALGLTTGGMIVVGFAAPTFAAGNSDPGLQRYLDNPGRQQATSVGAQCGSGAGSGAFGYFGKDSSLAGGADGQQTGINNSEVCGNRPE